MQLVGVIGAVKALIGSDTSDLDLDRQFLASEAGTVAQGIGAVMVLVLGMTTAAKLLSRDSKPMPSREQYAMAIAKTCSHSRLSRFASPD